MKTTFKPIRWALVITACCIASVVATLEVFNYHPAINMGNYYAFWKGVRDMDLQSSYGVNPFTNGKTETRREEGFGPIKIGYVKVQ